MEWMIFVTFTMERFHSLANFNILDMKFSYNQLQTYFTDTLPSAEEIATTLGLHAFELEGVEQLENGDTLIEWDILPNRSSDCLSYMGIIREIEGLFQLTRAATDRSFETSSDISSQEMITLNVEHPDLVPLATKIYFENVKIEESPEWLKTFMESQGQRSINNVVDLTNYVMFITGQPVHAFDYDKLAGSDITIRMAQADEEVIDLTGDTHVLTTDILVIADQEKALDIGGVKGGAISGVDEHTTKIMLSACCWNPEQIRKTTRSLKLHTDASKRFENDVPFMRNRIARDLFCSYMVNEFGATVSDDHVIVGEDTQEQTTIALKVSDVNRLLGTELNRDAVVALLTPFGFTLEEDTDENVLHCTSPEDRTDLNIKQDWIEEVGRIYGYSNIVEAPIAEGAQVQAENPFKKAQYAVIDALVSQGFYEVYNRSITTTGVVKLKNPFTSELGSLRDNLLDSLKVRAEKNLVFLDEPLLFEFGNVFTGITGEVVNEQMNFAGIIGRRKIKDKQKNDVFLQTKGYVELVCDVMHVSGLEFVASQEPDTVADLMLGEEKIGFMGVNFWELNFTKLVEAVSFTVDYTKPSKYPRIDRDVAVFVPTETTVGEVRDLIDELLPAETQSFELFDVFEKEDKKSFAFRMVFQSHEDTLSDVWANGVMDTVYKALEKKGYEIR